MTDVDVSIVIPVRNGGNFLRTCAEFIHGQTYGNYEVIFVVDGSSSDDTVSIANEVAAGFERSRVIVQNDGLKLGGNRNLGLQVAEGSAVWFTDVDDAPAPDFVKDMFSLLKESKADFVCCNFMNVGPDGIVKEKRNAVYHSKVLERKDAWDARNHDIFPVSTWSKLFKRSFLVENDLLFDESFAEDIHHTYRCLNACERICIYDRPLYAYRQTEGSICRDKSNIDKRGHDEIQSYDRSDLLCNGDIDTLKRNALMKIRSSGHMTYHSFMEYARSEKNHRSYETYLKGTFEGWWHLHLPTTYFIAIRTYVVIFYKRNGTLAMNKKFW